MARQHFGERINRWLAEAPGETFTRGKWRFWFPVIVGFTFLNALLTALVFRAGGQLENYMAAILIGVGSLLSWLCVGFLHYSDAHDRRLARGVSALDSITLCFVIAHFCFLLWAYGRLHTLQAAEAEYNTAVERFNAEAKAVNESNARIAEALDRAAEAQKERARIEADTAYQLRKAAERGARITRDSGGITADIRMAAVELAKPPAPPATSSTAFLTTWDQWIRLANFGELILAAVTLIFIRNRSAKTNAPAYDDAPYFAPGVVSRIGPVTPVFAQNRKTHVSFQQEKTPKTHVSFDPEGLKRLREALKDISFRLPGISFKADVKDDCVWIRAMRANQGTQETAASAKAKLSILDDAIRMPREQFQERLERFLRKNGFEID